MVNNFDIFSAFKNKSRLEKTKLNKPLLITLALLTVLIGVVLFVSLTNKVDRDAAVSPILAKGMLRIGLRTDLDGFALADESGKINGFEADIAAEITTRLLEEDIPTEVLPINSKSARLMIINGDIDLALGAFVLVNDSKVAYTNSYFTDALVFLTKSGYSPSQKLADTTIGVISGSYADRSLKDFLTAREIDAQTKKMASVSDALQALEGKRISSFCDSNIVIRKYTDQGILPETILPHGYCVMVDKNNANLLLAVSEIIDEMQKDGTIDRLVAKWGLKNFR